jgi:uncharacterized protein (DUF362 family)/NAD-dependent dihydropyrimidine dehydrogenase PreA subunit
MTSRVSIIKAPDYEPARVLDRMRECLVPLGGMGAFVRPGAKVLIKPNLLGAFAVEKAVTTHPSVIRAAILLAQEAGGKIRVGDSPGVGSLGWVARACGVLPVLEETGAGLADFKAIQEFENPDNVVAKKLVLARAAAEADVIISLPKLKTHGQLAFTGALKNQYGLVPGTLKCQWHFRLQDRNWLAALMLDIHRTVQPDLAIMDAIIGMEGQGPSGGSPRQIGALLAGSDLAAVDTLACFLIGLDPRFVPILEAVRKQRAGAVSLNEIEVVGEDWQQLRVADFKKVTDLTDVLSVIPLPRSVLQWIRSQWTARPRIDPSKCNQCGICENYCPVSPSAIHPAAAARPKVEDKACIRCYCCHEFCPSHAIELRYSWLSRTFRGQALSDKAGQLVSKVWPWRRRTNARQD